MLRLSTKSLGLHFSAVLKTLQVINESQLTLATQLPSKLPHRKEFPRPEDKLFHVQKEEGIWLITELGCWLYLPALPPWEGVLPGRK